MSSKIRVIPWLEGTCSIYAVVRDDACLADIFIQHLKSINPSYARRLLIFLNSLASSEVIREALLRPELPTLGVFALYNHKDIPSEGYNPSRLLCSYVGSSSRILIVGSGFIKTRNEPIQLNALAKREALSLYEVARELRRRIDSGEICIAGSELIPQYHDSLEM